MTQENRRCLLSYAALILLLLVLAAASVCIGSVSIPLSDVLALCTGGEVPEMTRTILLDLRLPRALAAILLGGGLALSGYLLQTFFHNPLAGPYVLGISSGAKLVIALVMIFFLSRSSIMTSLGMTTAAFFGSLLCTGFVLLAGRRVRSMSVLVICGVMIGYICSAVTEFAVTFADDADIVNLHNWSQGSFSGISMDRIPFIAALTLTVSAASFLLSKPISAYQMGENYAASLGVNLRVFRTILILLSSLLSACVTAFAGPVSFVGLAVPQITRSLLYTSRPTRLIPACFLSGSIFCLFCDLLARTLLAPTELSISTVTAVFGAPIAIAIMLRQSGQRS